jgi:uncharacterized membrane protein YdbT with pleckstrin-like domain
MAYLDELLAPGEVVLHRTRRHWLVLVRSIAAALVLAALALLLAVLYGTRGWGTASSLGLWGGLALLLVAVLVALPGLLRWENEIYLVTERRVLKVEGVLNKRALDSGLAKVNDVRLTQTALGRLLGYGTLEIITASDSGINRLEFLPRPLVFKRAMLQAAESRERPPVPTTAAAAPAPAGRSAADRLAELDELRRRALVSDEEYRRKRAEILADL